MQRCLELSLMWTWGEAGEGLHSLPPSLLSLCADAVTVTGFNPKLPAQSQSTGTTVTSSSS